MSKFLKYFLFSVLGLVVLFIVGAAILVTTVDPNDYKIEIAQEVKKATGRDLNFEGDIGFNFFPWLGLKVGPVAMGNASGFMPKEMVRINKAEASLEIMPLLSGTVSVGRIVLDGFTLNLAVNKQGVTNWDDLAKGKGSGRAEKSSAEQPTGKDQAKGGQLENMYIGGVAITNANVVYDDRKAGTKSSVTDLNLLIGEIADGVTTPIEMTFNLDLNNGKITTRPKLAALLKFDKAAGTVQLTDLIFSLLNLETKGSFFAKTGDKGVAYSGELELVEASLKELMKQLGMDPLITTDPAAMTRFSSMIKVDGDANNVLLEELIVKLDDTTITGNGSVNNFAKPAIKVAVNVDDIDVDRYMPPSSDKEEGKPESEKQSKTDASDTPAQEPDLSGLRDLDLQAKLTLGKIKVMNMRVTDILCQLVAKDGILTVKPFSAKLYEGGLNGVSVVNAKGKIATWEESAVLTGVQAGPLFKDLLGKDPVVGAARFDYALTGSGLTPDNIKKSISGKASFAFSEGAVNGVNIPKMLRDAVNTIKGKPVTSDEPVKTDFTELSGSTVLDKGHVTNNDLLMQSPLLRITGKGWVNLPKNDLDYKPTVTVVGTLKGQDGESLEDLKGVAVPLHVKGSLADPKVSLDTKALGEALFKSKLKDGLLGKEKPGVKGKDPVKIFKGLF
jgi:AsmA protein